MGQRIAQLHSITVKGVHPLQCVMVTDSQEYANQVVSFLKRRFPNIADCIYREPVEDYYPDGYTNSDHAINEAMKEFKYYTPAPKTGAASHGN